MTDNIELETLIRRRSNSRLRNSLESGYEKKRKSSLFLDEKKVKFHDFENEASTAVTGKNSDPILARHNVAQASNQVNKASISKDNYKATFETMKRNGDATIANEVNQFQLENEQDNIIFLQGPMSHATYTKLVGAKNIATIKEDWMKTYTGNFDELTRTVAIPNEEKKYKNFCDRVTKFFLWLATVSDVEAIVVVHLTIIGLTIHTIQMIFQLLQSSYCTKFGAIFYSLCLGLCLIILIYCILLFVVGIMMMMEHKKLENYNKANAIKKKAKSRKESAFQTTTEPNKKQSVKLLEEDSKTEEETSYSKTNMNSDNNSLNDGINTINNYNSLNSDDSEYSLDSNNLISVQERLTDKISLTLEQIPGRSNAANLYIDINDDEEDDGISEAAITGGIDAQFRNKNVSNKKNDSRKQLKFHKQKKSATTRRFDKLLKIWRKREKTSDEGSANLMTNISSSPGPPTQTMESEDNTLYETYPLPLE